MGGKSKGDEDVPGPDWREKESKTDLLQTMRFTNGKKGGERGSQTFGVTSALTKDTKVSNSVSLVRIK